jgi:hypothetical protein
MPSRALARWLSEAQAELDELEQAHVRASRGRSAQPALARQLCRAYLVSVSAQFQRFCRDLHSEASQRLADAVEPKSFRGALLRLLTEGRRLDAGNAVAGTLGPDFDRLGLAFLAELEARAENRRRRLDLERLNVWRNAIVHLDFTLKPGREKLVRGTSPDNVRDVRRFREACDELAREIDRIVRAHVSGVVGGAPWR